MSHNHYEVVVNNIGSVYCGADWAKAYKTYKEYVSQSKTNYGRAAGESVFLMDHTGIRKEFVGSLGKKEFDF